MITAWLRRAILAAAGTDEEDPLLRPGGGPGSYASSLPFRLAGPGQDPRDIAKALAARLITEPDIATAAVTGPGYLTVTVTHDALAGLAVRVAEAGESCAASDALRGRTVPVPPAADLTAAPDWPQAQAALAAELTARLAAAAGATPIFSPERTVGSPPDPPSSARNRSGTASPRPSGTRATMPSASRSRARPPAGRTRRRRPSPGIC